MPLRQTSEYGINEEEDRKILYPEYFKGDEEDLGYVISDIPFLKPQYQNTSILKHKIYIHFVLILISALKVLQYNYSVLHCSF